MSNRCHLCQLLLVLKGSYMLTEHSNINLEITHEDLPFGVYIYKLLKFSIDISIYKHLSLIISYLLS